ncbi:3-dehydroquinate synthase [Lysinibacillus sphaericus]|uniref:3-dehydroquinate synthase n=3 Tax=Lysinibacillus TaxID=400634 RepID=AROB_LYSSC|nr:MULTISPECIES: 3-dehydroquinate synthase [Lysinibacillus]B1HTD2.1 RecName: Full=3-dehydroquinate synthase; Short=DHQS [Lysinibacillus sphaericus C3-41]MBE5083768.1 3-dehydroquinate synthase [Bacillus thuringiensis]ACA39548.1 3-dehydroquinate synthase [Lysinibacillus sphaericus C3-41]AMO34288.1 3-dehydroquinate synthase [Lysinibacillus sphaericus]AMR90599.1 3-dehydroquinate synthase [Lysinibacillus sphaericus]ANA44649.1 3-dehydroquinate synthase [Lysinibacillus sphaericus]
MRVPVATKSHHYEVLLGHRFLTEAIQTYADQLNKADKFFVFTDAHVWEAQGDYFKANFPYDFEVFILPGGEACKTFEQYYAAQTFLLEQKCSRKSFVFAFGGGAVGDLTGFVAATYMRGIPFIQIPTTILAHDSAVGGKTAINHPLGKNMIGAFYQPEGVIYDTVFSETLPVREIRSGTAELIKHAMISDSAWLEELMAADSVMHFNQQELAMQLKKGIEVKAKIVAEDETEQSVRKFLNLGHTYGHAIEAAAGYGKVAHGEAVMIGLVYCLLLSERYGELNRPFTKAFLQFAVKNGYPFEAVNDYTFEQLTSYLMKDKKTEYGILQFVLLEKIGKPFVRAIDLKECKEVDAEYRELLAEVLV